MLSKKEQHLLAQNLEIVRHAREQLLITVSATVVSIVLWVVMPEMWMKAIFILVSAVTAVTAWRAEQDLTPAWDEVKRLRLLKEKSEEADEQRFIAGLHDFLKKIEDS